MITKLYGTLDSISHNGVIIETGGIYYAIEMPPVHIEHISKTYRTGDHILLYTNYYIEAGVGVGNLIPRLVGFMNETDREFFDVFTSVKGLGQRKSLHALTIPVAAVCYAIETGDTFTLKKLPGIGGRMADKIIAELKGKVTKFTTVEQGAHEGKPKLFELEFEQEALEILIARLGYRRIEAENLVYKAISNNPSINTTEDLLQAIFKHSAPVS